MGSIIKTIDVRTGTREVWDALRDFGALHQRLVPGFVVDARLDGRDRVVTFASGAVATERLVSADPERRRLVYAVVDGGLPFDHHQSSVEVVESDRAEEGCRIVWTTDLLPDRLDPVVDSLMHEGAAAMLSAFGA
jgi:Polyketide cyclase / dehydrase and lipid transport